MSDFNTSLLRTAIRLQALSSNLVQSPYIHNFVKANLQTPLAFLQCQIVTFRNKLEVAGSPQIETARVEIGTRDGEIGIEKYNIMDGCLRTVRVLESHQKHLFEAKAKAKLNSNLGFKTNTRKSLAFLGFGGIGHYIYGRVFNQSPFWAWISIFSLVAGVIYFAKAMVQLLPTDVKNKTLLHESIKDLGKVSNEINSLSYQFSRYGQHVVE